MKIEIPSVIRDYAPRWTKHLEKRINLAKAYEPTVIEHKLLDMGLYNRCIVGEVNGFTNDSVLGSKTHYPYGCITCERFADEFDIYFTENDKKGLETHLKAYEAHILDKHEERLRQLHSKGETSNAKA